MALRAIKNIAKDSNIRLRPEIVITDFELAEINAVRAVFPESLQYGCFFHLVKNLWKKIQKLGLTSAYHSKVKVQMAFKQIEALAFLKPQEVAEGFTAIRATGPKEMANFFSYFEKTYIGRLQTDDDGSQRRLKVRFMPKFWSMQNITLQDFPRTSNAVEGYHNKINGLLRGVNEERFYRVLRIFQEEEQSTTADYLRFLQGDSLQRPRNNKQIKKEEKLKNAIASREESPDSPLMDHIKSIALILIKK